MDSELLAFAIFGAIVLGAAIAMVLSRDIVRALVWLATSFLFMAVLFLLLGAEFLAAIQIMVYVGAISVVILFGIMLTRRTLGEAHEN